MERKSKAPLEDGLDSALGLADVYFPDMAYTILHMAPELNMDNYDEGEVSALNIAAIQAWEVLNQCVRH